MFCGVRVALVPFSPVIVIGADTAGLATFSSAAVTSSDRGGGRHLGERQRDRRHRLQSCVSTAAATGTSSCWPATGSTGCGVMPSNRTLPSTAGLSNAGFSSVSAASSAAGSGQRDDADLTGREERLDPRDRVEGLVLGLGDRGRPVDGKARGVGVDGARGVADGDGYGPGGARSDLRAEEGLLGVGEGEPAHRYARDRDAPRHRSPPRTRDRRRRAGPARRRPRPPPAGACDGGGGSRGWRRSRGRCRPAGAGWAGRPSARRPGPPRCRSAGRPSEPRGGPRSARSGPRARGGPGSSRRRGRGCGRRQSATPPGG